jgi:hypothetical protein
MHVAHRLYVYDAMAEDAVAEDAEACVATSEDTAR